MLLDFEVLLMLMALNSQLTDTNFDSVINVSEIFDKILDSVRKVLHIFDKILRVAEKSKKFLTRFLQCQKSVRNSSQDFDTVRKVSEICD